MTIVEQHIENKPNPSGTNKVSKDMGLIPEISELVSPIPMTSVFLCDKLYKDFNEEAKRNEEALKKGRELGGTLDAQEWGDDDSDDFIPDEELQSDNCLVM